MHFFTHADQACNLELALLFDDIDTGMRMAAGTDKYYVGLSHDGHAAGLL
jgi:hypothetical protein